MKTEGFINLFGYLKMKKNEEKVDLSGGPDLHYGKCKFRIKVPDKFKAGERKILKLIFGKNPNKEDFILKVHMTILEKTKNQI